MASIGLVIHHERPEAADLAREAIGWLTERGHGACLPPPDADLIGRSDLGVADERFGDGLDVVMSIGGDGTMLRSVALVGSRDLPVLGVNMGQMGYLTEVERDEWSTALDRFLKGEHDVDERMLLDVEVQGSGPLAGWRGLALNEAVLEKTPIGHTVRLAVHLDGEFFTTYAADSLIVGTPTGSTAYSLSARGPIIAPSHRAILLTPVAPHMLFDRALVLDPTAEVRLAVCSHRAASLSVDGHTMGELRDGDSLVCTASTHAARLVTFGDRNFHRILKAKFGLSDR
jgi:NAD+ kinase